MGDRKLKFGGRDRVLRFDFNAIVYLEEHAKIDVLRSGLDLARFQSAAGLRLLLGALIASDCEEHGESLTPGEVGRMISLADLQSISDEIKAAVDKGAPEPTGEGPPTAAS